MKKTFIFVLIIVAFSASFIFFITKKVEEEKPKVVVVLKELDNQYWQIVKAGAEKGFQDFDINGEVIESSDNLGHDNQVDILKKVLIEKPDVLVVSPGESAQHMSILEKFIDRKIPVLLVDTDVPLTNKSSYIGTDNYELGRMAGALLASELQPGNEVALIAGNLSSPVSGDRFKGAKVSLEDAGIKIVTEKVDLSNEPNEVIKVMRDVLEKHSDLKGVFATTDIMALSALEVLDEEDYKIPVVGADGIIEMVKLVEEGKLLSGTVAQNPYDMGYLSAQAAMNVAKGKTIDSVIDSGVDILIKGNGNERLTFLEKVLKESLK
ncbi:sugar ABC transporter substrate-binding protein [Metabacillus rhizolycopersici]|uniref:Sugar ABC transporter substrate-binding protein n=1 Tax=Metabacillus rhizolycopersici TaxID=2875709 RepID=A0ABS7UXL9_9BACI|nr:sugar ABC transporter substrate-binding protein [Metabacillus rhizolycopersici]MBZ5753067.1 sugar ABC transporter substrate-binding protein [Metabacillus rhizolycopersici]